MKHARGGWRGQSQAAGGGDAEHTVEVVPLNVLLSHALLDLTRASEDAGAKEVVLWSNFLRVVDDDGIERRSLPSSLRLSKRAVKATVDGMARRDWATVGGGVVRLTDTARRARIDWRAAIAQAESAWPASASIRAPLEAFVSRLALEHPHYPCGYGTADWRITGGTGIDWKAVPRDCDADTVTSLSLLALLSQALVDFTVDYESRVPFAMLVSMYIDAAFAESSVLLSDAPPVLMIAGNGKSSLERHGAVEVDQSKRVTLTPLGRSLRNAYRPTVEAVESSLTGASMLRTALEAVELQRAGHADHPDVRFVGGSVGFAEVSRLAGS